MSRAEVYSFSEPRPKGDTRRGTAMLRLQYGADRQQLCRSALADIHVLGDRNAGFAWLPFDKAMRAEPIVSRLRENGILVSGADPFATTTAVSQALRLTVGGVAKTDLKTILTAVRDAVKSVHSD